MVTIRARSPASCKRLSYMCTHCTSRNTAEGLPKDTDKFAAVKRKVSAASVQFPAKTAAYELIKFLKYSTLEPKVKTVTEREKKNLENCHPPISLTCNSVFIAYSYKRKFSLQTLTKFLFGKTGSGVEFVRLTAVKMTKYQYKERSNIYI